MSEKEYIESNEGAAGGGGGKGGGLAAEAANQLSDFVNSRRVINSTDKPSVIAESFDQSILSSTFKITDKERSEAVAGLGKSLDAMVKGDIPQLRERLKELGVSTKELDAVEKKLTEKVEAAKPLQDAILKGDVKSLQKMVATMDPKQLEEISELIQKHFDKNGMGIEVDYTDGKLIVSNSHGDRAVSIGKDKLDVIGINQDGSYDFNRHFRHENPAKEMEGLAEGALNRYINPPRYYEKIRPIYEYGSAVPAIEILQNSQLKEIHSK